MSESGLPPFRGYPVLVRRFELAGRTIELLGPGNFETLIDDPGVIERFTRDEYMPYWAEFWPASLLLADAVAAWGPVPPDTQPPLVLELGCGLGLIALLASHLGYRVIASDYEADALAFLAESARRNRIPPPETRCVDWRRHYPNLHFDRIIAAEVLYERRNLQPVAEFVRNHLAPGGFAVICDRNRSTADDFPAVAREAGLDVETTPVERPHPDAGDPIQGRLFHLRVTA